MKIIWNHLKSHSCPWDLWIWAGGRRLPLQIAMWPPSKPCCNFSTPTASPAWGNSMAVMEVCWRCRGGMLLQTSAIGLSVCWMERHCRWKNWWNPSRHQAGLLMRFQVNACWSIHLLGATPGEDSPHQRLSLLQGLLAASHKYQVGLTCQKGCKYMYRRLMRWYQVYMSWKSIQRAGETSSALVWATTLRNQAVMISMEIFGSLIRSAPNIKFISHRRSNTIHLPQLFSSHKTIHHWELESLWNSSEDASFGKLSPRFAKESITVLKVCDVLCQAHLYEADVKISRSLVEVFQSLARINHATSNANSRSHAESASLFTVNISICNIDVFDIGCVYIIYSACIYAWQFSVCQFSVCLLNLRFFSNWWIEEAKQLEKACLSFIKNHMEDIRSVFVEIWWYATSWQHGYGWLQPIV